MDELLGQVLELLPELREAGHAEGAHAVLQALTEGCNPREILMSLQVALGDLPEGMGPELDQKVSSVLHNLGLLLQEL